MGKKNKRIILDTNLWISFLISKSFSKLDKKIFAPSTILIFSNELLDEFLAVASRPKFKKIFTRDDLLSILDFIEREAEFIEVTSQVNLCRDKKDNFLLSLALDSNADFLVTGDEDLLVLGKIQKTSIISIKEFVDLP